MSNGTEKLISRWALVMALTLFNVALFSFSDWEFYVAAILIGIGLGDLFSNTEPPPNY